MFIFAMKIHTYTTFMKRIYHSFLMAFLAFSLVATSSYAHGIGKKLNAFVIENHLNKALALGDETVSGYIELHRQPIDIYQAVKGLGRVIVINKEKIIDNLQFMDNSFSVIFTQ